MFIKPAKNAKLFGVSTLRNEPAWQMPFHSHPQYHELVCVQHGRLHVDDGERVRHCLAGDLLFYPQWVPHKEWTEEDHPADLLYLHFSCPIDSKPGILLLRDPPGRIAEIASWMNEDILEGRAYTHPHMHAMLVTALNECERRITEPAQAPWVKMVRSHIQDHLADPLSLADLARVAGMSRYHFARAYKLETGRTPFTDVRTIRVQFARKLILSTPLPFKEIAIQAGLGDAHNLNRSFRRCFGIPPGKLRGVSQRESSSPR